MNRMWGDDKDPRVAADVDRYWDRQFKLASGWQPWWKRAWRWAQWDRFVRWIRRDRRG